MQNFNFQTRDKAFGTEYAVQCCLRLFIEDTNNPVKERKHAMSLYSWIGTSDISIDEIYDVSYHNANFILEIMEKYILNTKDSNLIINYGNAIDSLRFQKKFVV
jgi:hypothetical protein